MKRLLSIFKWIKNNIKYLLKSSVEYLMLFYTILGFASFLSPLDNLLEDFSVSKRLLISFVLAIFIYVVCFFAIVLQKYNKNIVKVYEFKNGKGLYIKFGDIFDKNILCDSNAKGNVNKIISINRYFDVIVDDNLIASTSLHGQFLSKVYNETSISQEKLNKYFLEQLEDKTYKPAYKTIGNMNCYDIGTTVKFDQFENESYILFALTVFNEELVAEISMKDYVAAIYSITEICSQQSEGYPVILPLIGGGLSRIGKSEQEILEYIVKTFKISNETMCNDIYIVIKEDLKNKISIFNL